VLAFRALYARTLGLFQGDFGTRPAIDRTSARIVVVVEVDARAVVRVADFVARCFSRCRSSFCIFCGGLALRFLVAPGRFRGSTFFGFDFPLRGFASTFAGFAAGRRRERWRRDRATGAIASLPQAAEKRRVPASNETVGTGFNKPSKSSTRNLSSSKRANPPLARRSRTRPSRRG
jgi:hypothetical protein